MVRLSEAIARANCVDIVRPPSPSTPSSLANLRTSQITPAFVKEAYALLSQSIIHVEKDDVQIDSDDEDDDPPAPDADADMAPRASSQAGPGESSPTRRGAKDERDRAATPKAATPVPKKPKVSITYDKYMTIMQKVVYHLADVERERNAGLPRSEVVQWYLEEIEGEISSVEQLESETLLIEKVLTKLVKVRSLAFSLDCVSGC